MWHEAKQMLMRNLSKLYLVSLLYIIEFSVWEAHCEVILGVGLA